MNTLTSSCALFVIVSLVGAGLVGCAAEQASDRAPEIAVEEHVAPSRTNLGGGVSCHFMVAGCGGTWTGNPGGVDDLGAGYGGNVNPPGGGQGPAINCRIIFADRTVMGTVSNGSCDWFDGAQEWFTTCGATVHEGGDHTAEC